MAEYCRQCAKEGFPIPRDAELWTTKPDPPALTVEIFCEGCEQWVRLDAEGNRIDEN